MPLTGVRIFLLLVFVLPKGVTSHGALVIPEPRNAIDRNLPLFIDGKFPSTSDGCNCADPKGGCPAARGQRKSAGGQACLWFSNGCTIGCPVCNGFHGHTNVSLCENPFTGPTLNDPKLRTMNIHAVAGSKEDVYRFNPWRAPGSAPVKDACGMAGGAVQRYSPDEAVFITTKYAKQGDLGSKVLPKSAPKAHWQRGSTAEVAFGIRYNHGGGYSYRLCPANETLTEACFQKIPLNFSGRSSFRWNNGSEWFFNGTYVTEGTFPPNSMWARYPVPRINDSPKDSGSPTNMDNGCKALATGLGCRQFDPICPGESKSSPSWHKIEPHANDGDVEGECSGDWTGGILVDRVAVPATLLPGDYVLGWRWDCEETAQIWQSCADIRIL